MVVFHACPRCGRGDLITERDEFGPYWRCLQCGHYAAAIVLARGGHNVLPFPAAKVARAA